MFGNILGQFFCGTHNDQSNQYIYSQQLNTYGQEYTRQIAQMQLRQLALQYSDEDELCANDVEGRYTMISRSDERRYR